MAWGFEKSFIIEHDDTVRKRIDCKDCSYYDKSDKSCMKRPLYLPEDGYNSWKTCAYFELDGDANNYQIKQAQLNRIERKEYQKEICKPKVDVKKNTLKTENRNPVSKNNLGHGYRLILFSNGKKPKGLSYQYITVALNSGRQIKVQVGLDSVNKKAYVNERVYTEEAIRKVKAEIS